MSAWSRYQLRPFPVRSQFTRGVRVCRARMLMPTGDGQPALTPQFVVVGFIACWIGILAQPTWVKNCMPHRHVTRSVTMGRRCDFGPTFFVSAGCAPRMYTLPLAAGLTGVAGRWRFCGNADLAAACDSMAAVFANPRPQGSRQDGHQHPGHEQLLPAVHHRGLEL